MPGAIVTGDAASAYNSNEHAKPLIEVSSEYDAVIDETGVESRVDASYRWQTYLLDWPFLALCAVAGLSNGIMQAWQGLLTQVLSVLIVRYFVIPLKAIVQVLHGYYTPTDAGWLGFANVMSTIIGQALVMHRHSVCFN